VKVKILYGPNTDFQKVPKIKELIDQGKIEARPWFKEPPTHFMVCDNGRHIRIEKVASLTASESERATFIYSSIELGWKYNRLFDELWSSSAAKE
jgi:hypothetical protein